MNDRLVVILDFESIVSSISPETGLRTADIESLQARDRSDSRILIAEDSPLLSKLITDCLKKAGYEDLVITGNGQEAWDKICELKARGTLLDDIQCIITDIEMPQMDGHRLTKLCKGSCAVDPALFSMLKDLRKKMSKKLDVPPYVIFQDPSLEAMATTYPVTLEELQNIPGVGAGKAKRYGQEFCQLIKKHCEENEIERPEDLRVRTVANKSKIKVSIIQAIDRKVALDDIALSKGLDFSELLDEVEAIVYSGTRLNIDYFLEEIMDEDHMLDIYDYFKESTTDKIDDAMDELGDDYTEDEIRLVRIKFISEMAN